MLTTLLSLSSPSLAAEIALVGGVEHQVDDQPGLGLRVGAQIEIEEGPPLYFGLLGSYVPGALQAGATDASIAEIAAFADSGDDFQVPIERRARSVDLVTGLNPVQWQRGALRGGPFVFGGLGLAVMQRAVVVSGGGGQAAVEDLLLVPTVPIVSGLGLDARMGEHLGLRFTLTGHRILGDQPQFDPNFPPFGRTIHVDRALSLDLVVSL